MAGSWDQELEFIRRFVRDMENRLPLPEASSTELSAHAEQVGRLQDLLALIAALPQQERPPAAEWDEALYPLWKLLYKKGDDIDRYVLADLWRGPLLDAGEVERYLFSTAATAAAARNFFLFDEALDLCREGRHISGGAPSSGFMTLVNIEGMVRLCQHDYDTADALFREMGRVAAAVPEERLLWRPGIHRADAEAIELLNLLDCHIRRGHATSGLARSKWAAEAKSALGKIAAIPCSEGMRKMAAACTSELAIVEGRFAEARAQLVADFDMDSLDGPLQYSISPLQLRLLSMVASVQEEWHEAYRWIRMALKQVTRRCYPSEEQFILEQAQLVIRGFQACADTNSREMIVQDLAQLLEDKDWYTGRSHSRSVASLAVRIGEHLNDGPSWEVDVPNLRFGGLLHDVGKLSIPWSLLNKIAPISKKERRLLEEHPARGARLLEVLGMRDIVGMVEMHHEHLDGSGYPRGLPPEPQASIIAVCDVYEAAITPNRRYKDAKSPQAALGELSARAGSRYDPEVVKALVATAEVN